MRRAFSRLPVLGTGFAGGHQALAFLSGCAAMNHTKATGAGRRAGKARDGDETRANRAIQFPGKRRSLFECRNYHDPDGGVGL